MKICILGDCHFGMRGDKLAFHNYCAMFYQNVFFPYLKQNRIYDIIQTGDLFDRRKFINYNTLHLSKKYFFSKFQNTGLTLHTYPGNHDAFYRNTISVNSIELVLKEYIDKGFIKCYTNPTTVDFGGVPIDMIPWICRDNETQIKRFIQDSKSQIVCGHFEIQGFEMEQGHVCLEGMAREDLLKYEMVMSGHFHHKSSDGHIFYVGAPNEMTWSDYNDDRGFHIFDTETRDLKFISNPYKIHHKIKYDDSEETIESIQSKDYSEYKNTNVKVIVDNKTNPFLFDTFMDKLYEAEPLDINIVENFTEKVDEITLDQADDTTTLINKYVDGLETNLDKERLKNVMRDIYVDAENFESVKDLE